MAKMVATTMTAMYGFWATQSQIFTMALPEKQLANPTTSVQTAADMMFKIVNFLRSYFVKPMAIGYYKGHYDLFSCATSAELRNCNGMT